MPRKGAVPKRQLDPDPILGSRLVNRFINKLIKGGKKSVAETIFYGALHEIRERHNSNPLDVFEQAVRNCMPQLEVRGRRVGGATYQVPVEVRADRQVSLAIRWLVQYARQRSERTMRRRLSAELWAASQNEGGAIKRKDEMHRMAEANKAYSHYRW
ncbi:MAG: 30S ribosomal protein S7 [Armatimonadetes bacterium]|nr:30S ribosomal protein S7 [Armatimonadota bacterium]